MSARTIHPFPARMAPDIALKCMRQNATDKPLKVLDPMCGSGTVLSIACEQGHAAVGFDVDPLAVLMSRVAVTPFSRKSLQEEAMEIVRQADRSRVQALPWRDRETQDFAKFWFAEAQRSDLNRISRQINEVDDQPLRNVLQLALSRTIVTKAPKSSLAADTSHSRPHRVAESSGYDVSDGFLGSVRELERLLARRTLTGRAQANLGDVRDLRTRSGTIDLVVTSPPYLNAIDYLRGHRLSLIWLGYSIGELRAIRSGSVGAERALDGPPSAQTMAMVKSVESSVSDRSLLPRSTIARYARDLTLFASELHRVCRAGGRAVVVVGNSTLRGNFIRNDLLVRRAMIWAGFEVTSARKRELPEAKRYMPVNTRDAGSSMAKRMRTEIVITARKA